MKLLILGAGLMGPTAAFYAMSAPDVSQVILGDADQPTLERAIGQLRGQPGAEKLGIVKLDVTQLEATASLLAHFDGVVAALPQGISQTAIRAALQAQRPLIDLSLLPDETIAALRAEPIAQNSLIGLACGLEPGLTEIWARHLAEQLDQVDELHIKCGGIPARPEPPLGYKIVFGGRSLPLHEEDAQQVINGQLQPVARYSGVESLLVEGVGQCEAWHEGFMPWLLTLPALQHLRHGTQKTVRWPGYAAKVSVLKEMGLLSQKLVDLGGLAVSPKHLLDTLLYPRVKLAEGEADITIFQVEAIGQQDGQVTRRQVSMVDRFDAATGFTSMARTTAFTGAIVACMAARGDFGSLAGLRHPEEFIIGPHFTTLMAELARHGIEFVE